MSVKRLSCKVLLVVASLLCSHGAAMAKSAKQKPVAQDNSAMPAADAGALQGLDSSVIDPTTAFLIWQTSHKPELMNVEYLKHYLGNPDPQITQIGARTYVHYWYDHLRRKRCELYQEYKQPREIIESVMVFHLPAENSLDFDLLNKKLGAPVRSFYDHEAHPTRMYSTAPYTTLAASSPHNAFAVTKATVTYMGPVLASPGFDDMQIAQGHFKGRTQFGIDSNTNWREALAKARERVALFPDEAESHLALAHALRKTGNIQDAISQYKLALSMNKYNPAVKQQCFEGLKALRVLPANYAEGQATGVAGLSPGF